MAQVTATMGGPMNVTKNAASSLILEDHLKKVISKTSAKGWKASDNPFLPRSQHSAFGDFPPDFMPKKGTKKEEPIQEEAKKTFSSKLQAITESKCYQNLGFQKGFHKFDFCNFHF
jgi:hypothetical protein